MQRLITKRAFTLVELIVVVGILSLVITGMLQLYIYTSAQAEMGGNKTSAITEAQAKIEEIRNHDFDDIAIDYGAGGTPGNTFDLTLLSGKGVIDVDDSNPELLVLEVAVSWRNKYSRVIGEDFDLDGQLDGGEDINGDGKLSSPITLMSMITRR